MHLSRPTVSPDPNLLALLLPGPAPAMTATPPVAPSTGDDATFGALFDELASTSDSPEVGVPESNDSEPAVTLPFGGAPAETRFMRHDSNYAKAWNCSANVSLHDLEPASLGEEPVPVAGDQETVDEENDIDSELGEHLGVPPTSKEKRTSSRAAFGEPGDSPAGKAHAASGDVPSTSLPVSAELRPIHEPNEHAAEAAFATPRFQGLPPAALEHRSAQKTPPGIDRVIAAREFIGLAPTPPSTGEADAEVSDTVEGDEIPGEKAGKADILNAVTSLVIESKPASHGQYPRANSAVEGTEDAQSESFTLPEREKKFLTDDEAVVTSAGETLGIDVAKPPASMSARFLPAPRQHPVTEYGTTGVLPTNDVAERVGVPQGATAPTQTVSTAQEAVEVVLQAAADVSSREQKTVNLQISVGDADLNVRVELHANEVRATFRTDSPELRAALSHEWQSAATISTNGDRTLRIVPAVFNASEHSALNAFAGDTSSRERNQQARRDANERSAKAISIGQRSVVVPPRAVGSAHVASLTSRRLQTVA